ncbi:MAG: transposase [Chromatiaceae bacterium]|nr:transposase [Chromatiaceae bacterium]
MPRKARVLVPNCPHHIVQRGHNRNAVFLTDRDYRFYLENLKEWKTALGIKLYAWCLMTNHIHIVAEPGRDAKTLSLLMKRVNGRQSAYVNKLEGRSGSLWEGRYKASPIQRDDYLLCCCRYVELNPVRAGMVTSAEAYLWSSYRERVLDLAWGMLDRDACYIGLADTNSERRLRYRAYLEAGTPLSEKQFLDESVNRNQLTGNQCFIDEIERRVGARIERRGRGRPAEPEK